MKDKIPGLKIKGVHFCEPGKFSCIHFLLSFFSNEILSGGGKSRADTYSAITKNHVRSYINNGGNANTPEEFAFAISQSSGPANVSVMLGSLQGRLQQPPMKIEKLKDLHSFEFKPGHILVRKIPGIGSGTLIPIKELLDDHPTYRYQIIKQENKENPLPDKRTRQRYHENVVVTTENATDFEEENNEGEIHTHQSGSLWTCDKNVHCTCKYVTYKGYKNHIESTNSCKITVPSPRDTDKVINWYIKDFGLPDKKDLLKTQEGRDLILQLQTPSPVQLDEDFIRERTDNSDPQTPILQQWKMGDGLPKPKVVVRFAPEVHNFVKKLFLEGEVSDHKYTAEEGVKLMRIERNQDGSRKFHAHQWLKEAQV